MEEKVVFCLKEEGSERRMSQWQMFRGAGNHDRRHQNYNGCDDFIWNKKSKRIIPESFYNKQKIEYCQIITGATIWKRLFRTRNSDITDAADPLAPVGVRPWGRGAVQWKKLGHFPSIKVSQSFFTKQTPHLFIVLKKQWRFLSYLCSFCFLGFSLLQKDYYGINF